MEAMENDFSDIDLARYFTGECDPVEKLRIESWRNASSENEEVFKAALFIWEKSLNANNLVFDTEKALVRVHQNFDISITRKLNRNRNRILLYSKIAAIAAVILLPVLLFVFYGKEKATDEIVYSMISSGEEIKKLKLDDGSEVWLNKGSSLYIPTKIRGDEFHIKLEGEGFFQVAHHPKLVFKIETNSAIIRVLGTAFNLKAFKKENLNTLTVTDGKVLYTKINSSSEKIVEKGKEAIISGNTESIVIKNIPNENFLSWKTKTLKFSDTPFKEVATALSNYYGTSFEIEDSVLQNIPINTTIVDQPLEEVVKLLNLVSDDIVISKKASGYRISKKK